MRERGKNYGNCRFEIGTTMRCGDYRDDAEIKKPSNSFRLTSGKDLPKGPVPPEPTSPRETGFHDKKHREKKRRKTNRLGEGESRSWKSKPVTEIVGPTIPTEQTEIRRMRRFNAGGEQNPNKGGGGRATRRRQQYPSGRGVFPKKGAMEKATVGGKKKTKQR